jgi:hypothetical protein
VAVAPEAESRRLFLCDNDEIDFRGLLMKRCALILLLSITTAAQNSSVPAAAPFDGKSWWNYVKVLADDNMEGRETGSEGLRKAAAYIVEQLKNDGLEPAGSNGYYQPVKLISRQIDESGSSLALVRRPGFTTAAAMSSLTLSGIAKQRARDTTVRSAMLP